MISHTKMPMTTRSMTAAARRFHAWNTEFAPKKPLYDDEEEWEAKAVERHAKELAAIVKRMKEEDEDPICSLCGILPQTCDCDKCGKNGCFECITMDLKTEVETCLECEEEEEEILLTCFKCEKKYMGVEGNCCCGKCCSYCT